MKHRVRHEGKCGERAEPGMAPDGPGAGGGQPGLAGAGDSHQGIVGDAHGSVLPAFRSSSQAKVGVAADKLGMRHN